MNGYFKIDLFVWLLPVLLLIGCEERVDWELSPGENGQLVVECILTNELTQQIVKLSLSNDNLNDEITWVTDAAVTITVNQENYDFLPLSDIPGHYRSINPFAASPDMVHKLAIDWQGNIYEASTTNSTVSPLSEIIFNEIETDSFEIKQVGPPYHPHEQAFFEVYLDLSAIIPSDSSFAKLHFYTFNTIDASQLIPPAKEKIHFPKGTTLIIRKYGLNEGFGNYLRTLVIETEWQGGVYDESSSSLQGNISNGGLGYFAACSVLTDTMIVE